MTASVPAFVSRGVALGLSAVALISFAGLDAASAEAGVARSSGNSEPTVAFCDPPDQCPPEVSYTDPRMCTDDPTTTTAGPPRPDGPGCV